MKNRFAPLLASTFLFSLAAHAEDKPAAGAPAADYVMIQVNGENIRKSEVDDAWKSIFQGRDAPSMDSFGSKMKDKFLREVASEHVLYDEAEKEGFDSSPEVKATLEKLKRQLVIQELLKSKTKDLVTDDKLKAAYEAHLKATESSPDKEEFHARHILVKTKAEADDIEKKLKGGASFDALAKEKSEDKGSGASGGDLGWFLPEKMTPDFSRALLKLKKDEISPPVKTEFGWHVIQLEDRRKLTPPPFDEVKEGLKQEIGGKAVGDYVKGLMQNVTITELDPAGHTTTIPSVPPKEPDAAGTKAAPDAPAGN